MRWTSAVVVLLLAVFGAELFLSIRQESQTLNEGAFIYAGYSYWKLGDFGINPEEPPLVKLVATLPLLPLGLPVPPALNIHYRIAPLIGGLQFLYSRDAGALLFRARVAASFFAFALAPLVFFATREMFGPGAALISLLIFVLEPVILANGALVTTDMGLSACFFAVVYFFYRYLRRPSMLRLLPCCIITGLAFAAKLSAVVIVPIVLVVLAAVELALERGHAMAPEQAQGAKPFRVAILRLASALAVIAAVSVAVLWSCYAFRYAARPNQRPMVPTTAVLLDQLGHTAVRSPGPGTPTGEGAPGRARVIGVLEHYHLLPEAYLYGLTDVAMTTGRGRPMFLLGKLYPRGHWFYFPAAFLIKTSLALMALLVLMFWTGNLRRPESRRSVLFIAVPPLLFFAAAMQSKLTIGIRHVLPIYAFLIVLAGAGAWSLIRQSRRWMYVVAVILAFDAFSSLRAFPQYLPYSNEIAGGPSNTYKLLSNANLAWGSGMKAVAKYIAAHNITKCWIADDSVVDPEYYHIPCRPLPTLFPSSLRPNQQQTVPEEINGPVLIQSEALIGWDHGPGAMNAYDQFDHLKPDAVLWGEVMVYNGSFQVPKIAALSHFAIAKNLANYGRFGQAIPEAETASNLDPTFRPAHELLVSLYVKTGQMDKAQAEYQTALNLYQTLQPEFQKIVGPPQCPFAADISSRDQIRKRCNAE